MSEHDSPFDPSSPHSLAQWRLSAIALAYEITQLHYDSNLLTDAASKRGEYFFADAGIPTPRPATIVAWASLCAFGPIQGVTNALRTRSSPYHLTSGLFLLPFLPKLRLNEDTNLSLSRMSKAHVLDPSGRIRWGPCLIAESSTGAIIQTLSDGSTSARSWQAHAPDSPLLRGHLDPSLGQHRVPPLYSYTGEGWQFGIIQNLPSMAITLRDPFNELARHGIPELARLNGAGSLPRVTRLLFRFLDIRSARKWAGGYASAAEEFSDSAAREDRALLVTQIKEKEERRFKDRKSDVAKTPRFDFSSKESKIKGDDF